MLEQDHKETRVINTILYARKYVQNSMHQSPNATIKAYYLNFIIKEDRTDMRILLSSQRILLLLPNVK